MAELSKRVRDVMETDCAHTLEDLVAKPKPAEIKELIGIVDDQAEMTPNQRQRAVYMLGRMGRAEDLTGMAVFLASSDADYILSQTYNVDGGQWMS